MQTLTLGLWDAEIKNDSEKNNKKRESFSVCNEKQEFYDRLETSLDSKHQFGVCVFLEKRFSS
jgi:hypothetical protein